MQQVSKPHIRRHRLRSGRFCWGVFVEDVVKPVWLSSRLSEAQLYTRNSFLERRLIRGRLGKFFRRAIREGDDHVAWLCWCELTALHKQLRG